MKISLILGAFGSVAAVTALWQQTVPAALKGHVDALNAAQSMSAKLSVSAGGPMEEVKLTFSKPNLWKVETAGGFQLFDGHKIYNYDGAKKTYTETEATSDAGFAAVNAMREAWTWTSFFSPAGLKNVTAATRGKMQKMRGMDLTAVTLSFSTPGRDCVFYMDDKTGLARGMTFKEGDKNLIVFASELTLAKEPMAESVFAFTAPEGATKEVVVAPTATFTEVQSILTQNCMPCHDAQNHRSNYTLNSYDSIMASPGAVKVDNPDESFIIRSLKGDRAQRMPYKKAPLSAAKIQLIYDWMKAGAKND
jgi:outer membrane lipoprotein-sorting protein